jgi:hypothetical protein
MERKIPTEKLSILLPILGFNGSLEDYPDKISQFERKVEKSLIDTLSRLDIKATVKTDPFSLPYKHEIIQYLTGESYLNGCWEVYRIARKVAQELLNKDIHKLRFYIYIEVEEGKFPYFMGRVKYHFRYH